MTADPATLSGRVFISYRREQAAIHAVHLAREIEDAFGTGRVFLDQQLAGGDEWPERLRDALASAPVLLALIGAKWLKSADDDGRRCIDQANDWVRRELTTALNASAAHVIPILLEGAVMPSADSLPEELRRLVSFQARPLGPDTWAHDCAAVLADIERFTGWPTASRVSSGIRRFSYQSSIEAYRRATIRRAQTALRRELSLSSGHARLGDGSTPFISPDVIPHEPPVPSAALLSTAGAEALRAMQIERQRQPASQLVRLLSNRKVVILGNAGTGKTTLLNAIAAGILIDQNTPHSIAAIVQLKVRHFSVDCDEGILGEACRDALSLDFARYERHFFEEMFAQGDAILIVDGLDESPNSALHERVARQLDNFAARYPRTGMLIISRVSGYDANLFGSEFEHFELAPFSRTQSEQLLRATTGTSSQGAQRNAAAEWRQVEYLSDPRLARIADNPLMLSIIAKMINARGSVDALPRERHLLYDGIVDLLVFEWDMQRGVQTSTAPKELTPSDMRRALERVAFRLHAGLINLDKTSTIERIQLEGELVTAIHSFGVMSPHRIQAEARKLLDHWVTRAGLMVAQPPGVFAFVHRAIQEYLAACELVSLRAAAENEAAIYLEEGHLHGARWRTVQLLALSMERRHRAQSLVLQIRGHGASFERWTQRNLLFLGEVFAESDGLVESLDKGMRFTEPCSSLKRRSACCSHRDDDALSSQPLALRSTSSDRAAR